MKKGITFLIIFLVVLVTFLILLNVPSVKTQFAKFYDSLFVEEIEEYNENFVINELGISNNTYFYSKLSEENKKIYTSIANGIKNLKTSFVLQDYTIIDNDTTMKDVEKSMEAFFLDHPEVFYVENEYTVSTKHTLFNDYTELALKYTVSGHNDLENKIAEIKNEMNIYLDGVKDKSGVDAEIALHDMLGKDLTYYEYSDLDSVPQECHTIYGALVKKEAVCDGFAKALQVLLDRKNIQNIIVLGSLEKESHAWNLVNLEDSWYHVDLTSNKSIKEIDKSIVLHTYLNVTTSQIEKTHVIDNKEDIPEAKETKYNYFAYTGKNITVADNFNIKLKQILDKNTDSLIAEFGTPNISSVPEKVVDFLSRNRYNEYISNNKIIYYSLMDSFVLVKNK